MTELKAVHIIVHGQVQGVGFRCFTQSAAERLNVSGWVRNNYDGTVEIWGEGAQEHLEQFIRAARQGPMHGWVQTLDIDWQTATGTCHGFQIRY
ncbi:MAG: acylphosphatase [Anaerolineae bacterium]|nr:acylphosphatase [Anaerolineae bacterium]